MRRCPRVAGVMAGLFLIASAGSALAAERTHGGRYTAERIANLRANVARHDWAKKERDEAVKNAAPWLAKSEEELWAMVPGQDLGRCIDVTMDRTVTSGKKRLGCLKCGDKIDKFGNYPYEIDFEKAPWKITCPSCRSVFPTNDFSRYYASGIDERGLFNPARADKSLLFNTEHPDPKDPLHKYGVDDGFGYIDTNGRGHRFVGYYTWKYWQSLRAGCAALADAYLYTGDTRYARKAAVLLDRIADVYPSMDWKPYAERGWFHSDGNTPFGKIEGRIWETGVVRTLAEAYDKILSGTIDDPELYSFLKKQSERYKLPAAKGTRDLFVRNVDDNFLRCALDGVVAGRVTGNEGMHQMAVTICAMALDNGAETTKWLDWLFAPDGGAVPALIVGKLDRDGVSPEGGPGYALMWAPALAEMGERLAEYPRYRKHNVFRDFPQFRAAFAAAYRMALLGVATPNIGDSGATGTVGTVSVRPDLIASGFKHTRDPELAVAAYRANGNSADGLGRDIFSTDPDALSREIAEIGAKAGPRPTGGSLMSGYGLATLELGSGKSAKGLSCYYGRTIMHAHPDLLNFDVFAFGSWLTPDLGYPEFATAWPHRNDWTNNTLSHNLVVVDGRTQERVWGGHSRLYKQLKGFGVVELDGRRGYPGMKEYTRTMVMVEAPGGGGDAYVVDLFRVAGGSDHLYSFHGPSGAVTEEGLSLVEQKSGTYAGEDVSYAAAAKGFPKGYSFLYNVRRDRKPGSQFTLDWKAEQGYRGLKGDVHLRLHALTPVDDVALADGDPPQNKPGNPRRLGYALLHRAGKGLSSTFVSVIEPYQDKPVIRSVKRVDGGGPDARQVALRIELADGSVDHILYDAAGRGIGSVDGIRFAGKVGMVRETGGKVAKAVLVQGSELAYKDAKVTATPAHTGKVAKMNRELSGDGWIVVDAELPTDGSLVGQQLMVETKTDRDASYTITKVERDGDGRTRISCGPVSFVRGYAGPTHEIRGQVLPRSYDKGFAYDFEEGAAFTIPTHAEWRR